MLSLEEVKNVYRESNKKKKKSEQKAQPKPQPRTQPKYDRSSKSTHRSRQPANYKPYISRGVQEQKKKGYNETAGGRFTQGVIRNGFMAGFPSETKATYTDSKDKTRKVSESKAYKAGKVVGDFMSYGTGYGLAGKAIARATGKAVAKKAAKEVGEKVAKETAEKAVKKTAQKTAGKLAKAEDKMATKAGEKILKTNEKLGNKIAKSKAVKKYAEKKASKTSEVAKIAGTAKRKEAIAKDVGAKAAEKITQNLIADATAGTVLDTARAHGEGIDVGLNKEYAKYMGTNALLNVGMGAGMEGLGAGAKAVAKSQAAKKGAQTVRKLVNGKQKEVKVKSESHVPSTLKGREQAEKVGKIQRDFTEMPTAPKGKKMKDALSPEEIRQRRNVQNRYSEVTKESRARQEARGDYNRSLKKKGVQEERVRQVKDIAPEMPKSVDDYVARINTARKYADDNNINFSDVVKEHNGNRAEAINDLVARAEESKPVKAEAPREAEAPTTERVGYHAGDLGKAEYHHNQAGSQRHTGAYGTGTYFVGDKGAFKTSESYASRPINTVNYENYNLYRPSDAAQGKQVHDDLRVLNRESLNLNKLAKRTATGDAELENIRKIVNEEATEFTPQNLNRLEALSDDVLSKRQLEQVQKDAREAFESSNERLSDEEARRLAKKEADEFREDMEKLGLEISDSEYNNMLNEHFERLKGESGTSEEEFYFNYLSDALNKEVNGDLNGMSNYLDEVGKARELLPRLAKNLGKSEDEVRRAFDKTVETVSKYGDINPKSKKDSASTVFMKELGYEGVDVTGIKGLDDTEYGSVIYELKPEDAKALREESVPTQPKAEQPNEQNLGEFKSTERPKQYARDSGDVSQVADTVKSSSVVNDEYRKHLSEQIDNGLTDMRHMKNKEAVARAEARVSERGADSVAKSFIDNVDDGFQMTGERVAEAYVCARELIKNGDYKTADALIERLTIAESENARSVQAMRLFASLTPEGKVSSVLRILKKINEQHNTNVEVPDKLLDALRNAKTQKEINEAKDAISLHIWNNVPPNWVEKVNAWRYLSMLGNPKTHVRNLIGNVIFSPVKTFRNILATGLEHALVKDTSLRTKAVLNPLSKSDRSLKRLGKDSWDSGIGDVLSSGSKYIDGGSMNDIMRRNPNARVFLFPLLDKAYKANGWLLNKEDSLFMKPHYESAFAQYLKAKGYTAETATEEILKKAERYASEEALNSTYRDFSVLADKLNKFKRYSNTKLKDIPSNYDTEGARAADRLIKKSSAVAAEALVPFTKTPINILKRGIEYSPANVIGGCVKIGKALAKNDMDGLVKGIASLSAGTSGSAAFALGMYMSKQGLATGGIDFTNKEAKYNNMLGDQQYSIKVTKDFPFNTSGKDYSFTVDTFAPISIPFFMGVELGDGFDGISGTDLLALTDKITDPVFNLSMLSSLKNAFDNQYSSGNSVAEVARKTGESYVGQFIPTILGQTARTFQDEITGSTATDEDPNIRAYHTFANQMMNKIPKLADKNAPVVNDWGEKQTNDNRITAALQNYVNPLNVKEVKEDDVDLELRNLMDQGADNSVLPSSRPQSYTIDYNNEELRMSPKEFMKMKENTGTESKKKLRELFETSAYKKGSVEEKQKMIKEVYTNAKNYAKRQMLADRGYTKEDISWNLDLSEKDREKFGTRGKFLKMLKKTGVTPSEFSEMKADGLSVSDLRAAAEQEMSLKDYHIVKEVQDEYKGGYGAQAAVLHENGLLNLEMFDAAKKDGKSMVYGIKKNTYKVASAYSDAGYSADEIQDMIGDVEEIAEDIKQNYGSRTYSNGVVHVTPEGVQAYLDQRDDLSQQDKHNLWYIYGEGQPWFMKRNPY